MAGQPQRISYNPPIVHLPQHTKSLTANEAQPLLSAFLQKSREAAYLHPDAWLLSDGIKFGPKAGPSGGWAIHHLRRIEAGLRGETLATESKEELIAKFGEDAVPDSRVLFPPAKEVDDTRDDQVIEESGEKSAKDEKKRRKQEKRERVESEKAAKRVKVDDSDAAISGANTPYQDSMVGYGDQWQKDGEEDEWQNKAEYEQRQTILEGDIAERDPSHGRQVMNPPVIVKHDNEGKVVVPKQQKTNEDKAARKAAKKARKLEQRTANKGKG